MADYRGITTLAIGVGDDNDDDDMCFVDPPIPSNIALLSSSNTSYSVCTITLYVLRLAQPNDNWKIQILFENDTKYTFKAIPVFDRPKVILINFVNNYLNFFTTTNYEDKLFVR